MLQCSCNCNFIYSHKKNTTSLLLLFTKLMNAHQHYVQIPCAEFNTNRTTDVESKDRKALITVGKEWVSLRRF
jgi:hypothetical protein